MEEAIEERKAFERLLPGSTVESVMQFYKSYCFEDDFVMQIQWALMQAGLPSRGKGNNLEEIQPPEAKVIPVNGFDLEYMDVGYGVPIVFVHGSIADYRSWSHYQNSISEKHRYISYSRRYFGSQPWPDDGENLGIDTDADDLIALIEELDIAPVYVVSWSRGGRVAGLAAVKRPDLFKGAIHYEPIANSLGNSVKPDVIKARDDFYARFSDSEHYFESGKPERAVSAILENVFELERGQFDTEIMPFRRIVLESSKAMDMQRQKDKTARIIVDCELLGKTTVPTLVVQGERTHKWWKHLIQRFHECTAGSEFFVIDGVNHDGPIRKPEQFAGLISDFVANN